MIARLLSLFLILVACAQAQTDDVHLVVVDADKVAEPSLLITSANAQTNYNIYRNQYTALTKAALHILQPGTDTVSFRLAGEGKITSLNGDHMTSWAVREENSQRYLDITLADLPEDNRTAFIATIEGDFTKTFSPLILATDTRTALAATLTFGGVDADILDVAHLSPLTTDDNLAFAYTTTELPRLELRRASLSAPVRLANARLSGTLDAENNLASFTLTARAISTQRDTKLAILMGGAPTNLEVSGATLQHSGTTNYQLHFAEAGESDLRLTFDVPVTAEGEWQQLDFAIPAGVVVPVTLSGFGDRTDFRSDAAVYPRRDASGDYAAFLPASGKARIAWQKRTSDTDGALFFNTDELAEIRIGSGLLRQSTAIIYTVLQGELPQATVDILGTGEVLSVSGNHVTSWDISGEAPRRTLTVQLSRPWDGNANLVIDTQTALGAMPATVEPIRIVPQESLRHSGHLRISNAGSVRFQIVQPSGLMQLAPGQYPGGELASQPRQVATYRHPSADYSFSISADQILPELTLSETLRYTSTESDRLILGELELDIREAPLRELSIEVPADYAIATVSGPEVADYVAGTEVADGRRTCKILFRKALRGRHLIQLGLEQNVAAAEGTLSLPRLVYPAAKAVRSQIGVVMPQGYRVVPVTTNDVVEQPLAYFPHQTPGLQLAFRSKSPDWAIETRIEALSKNVQADVFHLYTLDEGVAYGAVMLNYFVAGAPVDEWRLRVPESLGNIAVEGVNVAGWRREGEQIVISLRRVVIGASTFLLTFEKPLAAAGGTLSPGIVEPIGVQGERGYVQVVSQRQAKSELRITAGNVLTLEASELPEEYKLLTSAPSLATFQYAARPFAVEMDVAWYQASEMANQIVDSAWLSSEVAGDGQIVTTATYYVKTRGNRALRLKLPESVSPWVVTVDGTTVNARNDGASTIIPLPATADANAVATVIVRYGQTYDSSRISLQSPEVDAPIAVGRWRLKAVSDDRLLVPAGGDFAPTRPVTRSSGWSWMADKGTALLLIIIALFATAAFFRKAIAAGEKRGAIGIVATAVCAVVIFAQLANMEAADIVNTNQIDYRTPALAAGQGVTIELDHIGTTAAMTSGWGVALGIIGMAAFGYGMLRRAALISAGGLLLGSIALLMQASSQGIFLGIVAVAAVVFTFIFAHRWLRAIAANTPPSDRDGGDDDSSAPEPPTPKTPVIASALIAAFLLGTQEKAQADEESVQPMLASLEQTVRITDGRIISTGTVTLPSGGNAAHESFVFLYDPAVLTAFESTSIVLDKNTDAKVARYTLRTTGAGPHAATFTYEMPLQNPFEGFRLPSGAAVVHTARISLGTAGWQFTSARAVVARHSPSGEESWSQLTFAPAVRPSILPMAKPKDLAAEDTRFFVEASDLYVINPGVVEGRHQVTVRPTQGQLETLRLSIPEPFLVANVRSGHVAQWTFDPAKRELNIRLKSAQSAAFALMIETQRGAGALPADFALQPVRVADAAGEVGKIAIAFGNEAQPETIRPEGVSPLNVSDFNSKLLPRDREKNPLATLHEAFRYGTGEATIAVRATDVAPEVRAVTKQVLSLGSDRLILAVNGTVRITRAGIFELKFPLPAGMELESASSPAISHWTEAEVDGVKTVVLHLNGRTIGEHQFALSFTGAAPGSQASWDVPRIRFDALSRSTGEYFINPERGIRIRAVSRDKVSQIDNAGRSGSLAFRLLQADWSLQLSIEELEPWVSVQVLHELHLREGQTMQRATLAATVENAAIKTLAVQLPELSESEARTVRATGSVVKDIRQVDAAKGLWELTLKNAVAGALNASIEWHTSQDDGVASQTLQTIAFPGTRKAVHYVAVRSAARLDISASDRVREWQPIDWAAIPAPLKRIGDTVVPDLSYRVSSSETPLTVGIKRHAMADVLKLRVRSAEVMSVVAAAGPSINVLDLALDVTERGALRMVLPEGAELFSTFVNREGVTVVRDGEAHVFYVSEDDDGKTAAVRVIYSISGNDGSPVLSAPQLSIPLENVRWTVNLPEGYDLRSSKGLELIDGGDSGAYGEKSYLTQLQQQTRQAAQLAQQELSQANAWLAQGEQKKASKGLRRAAQNFNLDADSNEDARVQLQVLRKDQVLLCLTTRRQRLYLDNSSSAALLPNANIQQALKNNPLLNGKDNYGQREMNDALIGNSSEENSSLSRIATMIVGQQQEGEFAPVAIDVNLPTEGQMLTFQRRVQVHGDEAMAIELEFTPIGKTPAGQSIWLVLLLAAGALVLTALLKRHG